jgi:murein DD-endopeptidase MepM/ murein hydrolase activator NlpD
LDARDTGIDLVARTQGTNEFHAIQCKQYSEDYRVQKKDIDSFFTASGKKPFTHRIIVSTTNDWSEHAEDALRDQQPPVSKIDLHDLENSQIDWSRYQPKAAPVLKPRKSLLPHQQSALTATLAGLKQGDRGKLIMACGTGKTFTSLKIAESVGAKGGRVLFLVPSLALLSQALTEWTQESTTPLHNFAVCSDTRAGKGGRSIGAVAEQPTVSEQIELEFEIGEIERAIYAKLVQRVGNRHHWEDWANDIAKIARTHIDRIRSILGLPSDDAKNRRVRIRRLLVIGGSLRRTESSGRREKSFTITGCASSIRPYCGPLAPIGARPEEDGLTDHIRFSGYDARTTVNSQSMRHRPLLLAFFLACSPAAQAKHVYQYTDANGIVHYTDQKPAGDMQGVKSTLVRTDHQPLIHMREDGTDGDRTLTFVNSAGGPVTLDLEFVAQENVQAEPPLPARVVLPGLSETRVAHITALNASAGFHYQLRYSSMPGDFRAQQSADAVYRLPFRDDQRFPVAQGFGGKASHTDKQNYYAVDIVMPEGTPVLAARAGVVMTVDNDFYGAGLDMAQYGDRANNIRIVHADGTMAVYAHLELEGARVAVGDHVRAGQLLALSGDTGYTSGPHLHFCVQVNADMHIVSVPFDFSGAGGAFVPAAGMVLGGQ